MNEYLLYYHTFGLVAIEMKNLAPDESDLFWSVTLSLHCPPQRKGGSPEAGSGLSPGCLRCPWAESLRTPSTSWNGCPWPRQGIFFLSQF